MNFFKVAIFFLLIRVTVCCEKNLDCGQCLQKSCRFIVTNSKETVCVDKDNDVAILKEIKKTRYCKFVDLYTKVSEDDNDAPRSPSDVEITKAIHAAKMKDVSRETTLPPGEYSTDLITFPPSFLTEKTSPANESPQTTEVPTTEVPTTEVTTTEEPITEMPTSEPITEISTTEATTTKEPTTEITTTDAIAQAPATEPATEEPITEKRATEITTQEPITQAPQEPNTEVPTTEIATELSTYQETYSSNEFQTTTLSDVTLGSMSMEETTEVPTIDITVSSSSELSNFQEITTARDLKTTQESETVITESTTTEETTNIPLLKVVTTEKDDKPAKKEVEENTENIQTTTEMTTQKILPTEVADSKPEEDMKTTTELPQCQNNEGNQTRLPDNLEDQLRDSGVILSDVEEMFMVFKLSFECKLENRNDSLMFAYVSSLCSIAKLSENIGINKFADHDQAWLMANRARNFDGTCSAVRYIRKKCRTPSPPKVRVLKKGLLNCPRSPLFGRVFASNTCKPNAFREEKLMKLARLICYSGELFLELYRVVKLHTYDVAYGLGNPSYRHPAQCLSLFFQKRHCFNKKH